MLTSFSCWAIARLDALVEAASTASYLKISFCCERFLTDATSERFVSCMRPHMYLQR